MNEIAMLEYVRLRDNVEAATVSELPLVSRFVEVELVVHLSRNSL